jgi:hypothetical protein
MMSITPPPRPADHPDRFLDAQEAIEAAVLRIVDHAVEMGWGEIEAIAAVVAVAENRMLSICENERVNRQIEELRKRDLP